MTKVRSAEEDKETNDNFKQINSFYNIHRDVLPNIFGWLSKKDLISSSSTCRLFRDMSQNKVVLAQSAIDYAMPVQCQSYEFFSSKNAMYMYEHDPYFFEILDNEKIIITDRGKLFVSENNARHVWWEEHSIAIGLGVINDANKQIVVVGMRNGHIHFFADSEKLNTVVTGHVLEMMAVSSKGQIVTVNTLGCIRLWELEKSKYELTQEWQAKAELGKLQSIALKNNILVLGYVEGVQFFSYTNNKFQELKTYHENFSAEIILIERNNLWVAGVDGSLRSPVLMLWHYDKKLNQVSTIKNYDLGGVKFTKIIGLAALPDKHIAMSCKDKGIRIFNSDDFLKDNSFTIQEHLANSIGFPYQLKSDEDGHLYYCGGDQRTIVKEVFASKMEVEQRRISGFRK